MAPTQLPDVVIVTWDTVRADHVGAHEARAPGATPEPSSTPTWDRLALEGTVFDEARTPAPVTLPAHASILTGLDPPRHGARDNGSYALRTSVSTLAEEFTAAGYTTAAFVSAKVLHPRHGLDRGFSHYDAFVHRAEGRISMPERRANTTIDSAIDWVTRVPVDEPVFLWVHLYDPHRLWEAPAPWNELEDPYRAEIAFTDAQTGRLLDHLTGIGRLRRSLVVITSDHGEALGEHGETSHSYFAYDSTMRVPLLFWAGHRSGISIPPGRRIGEIVSLVDLAPTLRALARLPARPTDGISLAPALAGDSLGKRMLAFESVSPAMGYGTAPIFGVATSDGEVWLDLPRRERFDLHRDPRQLVNLYVADDDALATSLFARFSRDWPPSGGTIELDAQSREGLAALGYVVGTVPSGASDVAVDPKDRVDAHQLVASNHGNRNSRRVLADFRALRAKHGSIAAIDSLEIDLLVFLGRPRDALALARESAGVHPERSDLQQTLGALASRFEARNKRIAQTRAALEREPANAELRISLATLLRENQDFAEAEDLHRAILAADPDAHQTRLNLAHMLVAEERDDEAVTVMRELRSRTGYDPSYDCLIGQILVVRLGRLQEGREAIEDCAESGFELSEFAQSVLDGSFETLED